MNVIKAALTIAATTVCAAHAFTYVVPQYDIKAGEAIVTNNCAACHGQNGVSIAPAQPNLAGQNVKYLYKQLVNFKTGLRNNGIMKAQLQGLTQQDLANVAGYFAAQEPWGPAYGDPKTVWAATKLYLGGDKTRGVIPCAGCHGAKGLGNDWAGFPRISGQHATYLATQLKAFRAAGRDDEGLMPEQMRHNDSAKEQEKGMMQTVASKLSDKDIRILADYLTAVH